jgi:hypothetical protein
MGQDIDHPAGNYESEKVLRGLIGLIGIPLLDESAEMVG